MDTQTKPSLESLSTTPLCAGLDAAQRLQLYTLVHTKQVGAGEYLFQEGEPTDNLYVVLSGKIRILKKDLELAVLGPGSALGEMGIFDDRDQRSATAQVVEGGELASIAVADLRSWLQKDHLVAHKVVHNLAAVMSKRLAAINEKLVADAGGPKRREALQDFSKILNKWSF